jgi:hypothetical protein
MEESTASRISTGARDQNGEESLALACGHASFLVPQLCYDSKLVQRFIKTHC